MYTFVGIAVGVGVGIFAVADVVMTSGTVDERLSGLLMVDRVFGKFVIRHTGAHITQFEKEQIKKKIKRQNFLKTRSKEDVHRHG